jgi:hypothetical protein
VFFGVIFHINLFFIHTLGPNCRQTIDPGLLMNFLSTRRSSILSDISRCCVSSPVTTKLKALSVFPPELLAVLLNRRFCAFLSLKNGSSPTYPLLTNMSFCACSEHGYCARTGHHGAVSLWPPYRAS